MRVIIFSISVISYLLIGAPGRAQSHIEFESLDSNAAIVRDSDGVVHILARTEHDMVFLQGWAHARDRLFQMDTSRRRVYGTLAELLGPAVLTSDATARTIGLGRAAERSLAVLSPDGLAALQAYAAGINAYVATHPLPPEYLALELASFEPWTPVDSLAVTKGLVSVLSLDLVEELSRTIGLLTYEAAGEALGFDGAALFFEDVWRIAPFDPASTVPDATVSPAAIQAAGRSGARSRTYDGSGIRAETVQLAADYLESINSLPHAGLALAAVAPSPGTNEWVIGGGHTVSGQPLLANDPHLDFSMPSIWYPIHLRVRRAGFDVIGVGLPGTPYVVIGNNRRISWGAANHRMDDNDIFQEQLAPDPSSPSGLGIVHEGVVEPIIPIAMTFRFNLIGDGVPDTIVPAPPEFGLPTEVLIVPRRNNGPIIGAGLEAGTALSLMFTAFSGTREVEAIRGFNLAQDLDDFIDALQLFDAGSQNWVYADVAGNIAYFSGSEVPLRRDLQSGFVHGLPPAFIRDGTSANTDWLPLETPQPGQAIPFEILPFAEMAQVVNPPAGYILNANNDTNGDTLDNDPLNQFRPGGGIRYIAVEHQIGMRAGRLTRLIAERLAAGPVSADDMRALQTDVTPLDVALLRPVLVGAFAAAEMPGAHSELAVFAADPRLREAAGRLADWDGSMPTGLIEGYDASDVDGERLPPTRSEIDASVAATLYNVWRSRLIANTIDRVLDARGLPRPDDERTLTSLAHLLRTFADSGGIGASGLDFFDVPGVSDPATRLHIVALRSLSEALDMLASDAFADAFSNSTNQDDYRWGRLHRVILPSALGDPFTRPSPLGTPPGFAIDGGYRTVDIGADNLRVESDRDFITDYGVSERYVAEFGGGHGRISARSSLPGGVSGVIFSPFYDNLLDSWLTNETYPLRQRLPDVFRHAVEFVAARPAGGGDDENEDEYDDEGF